MNEHATPPLTLEQKRLALLRRQRGERGAAGPRDAGIPRLVTKGFLRASFAQQRLWFLDKLAPGNPFYTVSLELPLTGAIEPDLLERALQEIARRHAALRTTFVERDGQPMQVVHDSPSFPMERIDLSVLPHSAIGPALEQLNGEEATRGFDLERGPLALARLVRIDPLKHHLFLTLHHIVCDGWSLRVLGRELSTIYSALAAGKPHGLPELPVQYGDFSAWQRETLAGSRMTEHLAYWSSRLAGAPELAIITDYRRPAIPTYGGAFVPLSIAHDGAARIRQFCANETCTPFMVLLSAWMVLLGRLADMDDILVAVPSANRDRRELEGMIGFFVNTLVMRGDLSDDPSFRQVIDRVRGTCLDAFAHDEMPFDRLIEELAPERRGDRNPLAQVIFQLFSAPDRTLGSAAPAERQRGTSKFDLRLDLWDTEEGYAGELEYSTDLFAHGTAELMGEQFQVLLHELLANPDQPISEAGLMSQREFDWQLAHCNRTDRAWPADASIVDRFKAIAARHGDTVALLWPSMQLTYAELDAASDGAAVHFVAAGVRAGDHVATLLPRSPEMIVAWLGILKAGAAYVPLDATTPPARVAALLDTVQAAALVTDDRGAEALGESGFPLILADLHRWRRGGAAPVVKSAPTDVANIMFTSGSTGKPKAVLLPHQGIVRLAVGQEFWQVRPGEGIAQGSNCAFDAATLEVWTALLNGCRLVGVNRDELLSPERMRQRIAQGDFNHLFITTAWFHRLVEEAPDIFAPLKSLVTGGSRLEPASARKVLEWRRPGRFVNAYGPTETTTLGTVWPIEELDERAASVPIGLPICNGTAYVLDRLGRLVPRGVPGELFLGGPGVALGYWNEPEHTARKFGPSPFREGERLYATGDRVRRRHDGVIEFLGRFDDQVKIRGFRVEPDEVAAALRSHARIAQAEVLITPSAGEGRLVAFYTPASEDRPGEPDSEAVAYWRRIYEDVVYQDVGTRTTGDAQFDIAGWTDSATGELLSEADMAEQIGQTCHRILALGGKDILEFGCGTGLIIFALAAKVNSITGIDISDRAIEHIRKTANEAGIGNISLQQGSMEVLAEIPAGSFDTVVLNSTVQYFPSLEYLEALIPELLRVTRPAGAIFLGDIRHLGLLETFHGEIALDRADRSVAASTVAGLVGRKVEEEQELLLDPQWFLALRDRFAEIGEISIRLKRGNGHNELARFRYDVVLQLGERPAPRALAEVQWDANASLEALFDRVSTPGEPAMLVRGIPNARVASAHAAVKLLGEAGDSMTVGTVLDKTRNVAREALSPEDLWQACEARGLVARLGWSADLSCLDLLLSADDGPGVSALAGKPPEASDTALANSPGQGRSLRRLETELAQYLERLLPDYMLPQGYVRLPRMPLTANGKVDKKALAAALPSSPTGPARAPRNETEKRLAEIFCAVLKVPHVGIDDDFFRLGGHSLKATQVVSRITGEFGVSLPLRAIFENGTVAGLADAIALVEAAPGKASVPIVAANDDFDIDAMDDEALERALASLDDPPAEEPRP